MDYDISHFLAKLYIDHAMAFYFSENPVFGPFVLVLVVCIASEARGTATSAVPPSNKVCDDFIILFSFSKCL